MGKVIAVCIIALLIDFIVIAMCKAAKRGDTTIDNPGLIKIRGDKRA